MRSESHAYVMRVHLLQILTRCAPGTVPRWVDAVKPPSNVTPSTWFNGTKTTVRFDQDVGDALMELPHVFSAEQRLELLRETFEIVVVTEGSHVPGPCLLRAARQLGLPPFLLTERLEAWTAGDLLELPDPLSNEDL